MEGVKITLSLRYSIRLVCRLIRYRNMQMSLPLSRPLHLSLSTSSDERQRFLSQSSTLRNVMRRLYVTLNTFPLDHWIYLTRSEDEGGGFYGGAPQGSKGERPVNLSLGGLGSENHRFPSDEHVKSCRVRLTEKFTECQESCHIKIIHCGKVNTLLKSSGTCRL